MWGQADEREVDLRSSGDAGDAGGAVVRVLAPTPVSAAVEELERGLSESPGVTVDAEPFAAVHTTLAPGAYDVLVVEDRGDRVGLDEARRLLALDPALPVLLVAYEAGDSLLADAAAAGVEEVLLVNEVDPAWLARRVRYLARRRRAVASMWARATEDPLTHLASRLGFDAAAHALFDLTARSRLELDVLFLDLDGLKRINDEWGHAAGDEALVATATVLRASTRRSDLVARVGGDEFCVILVGSRPRADEVVSRIQQGVQDWNGGSRRPWELSVSIGVATHDRRVHRSLEQLIAQADSAMYEVKATRRSSRSFGRDRSS